MNTTRIGIITLALCAILSSAACGGSSSAPGSSGSGGPTVMIRMGDTGAATSLPAKAQQRFVELVQKYSNGHVKGKVFPSSQLGTFSQMATGMKSGTVTGMFIQPDALGEQVDLGQVDAWPFMFHNGDEMEKAWNGNGGHQLTDAIKQKSGYVLTAASWNSPRDILLNKPVANLAEAKGSKVRVPNEKVYINQMKYLGITAVGMNIADVFTAMQQNVVNGMEATLQDADAFSLADVTKTIITTDHVTAPKTFIFWGQWLDGLSASDRSAVMRAAKESSAYYSQLAKEQQTVIRQKFQSKGVKFVSPGVSFDQLNQIETPLAADLPDLAHWADVLKKP